MALLKRFELWLLLILIGGGLYYVLNLAKPDQQLGQRPHIPSETSSEIKVEVPSRFTLQKTVITRDTDHFLVEIEVLCRNQDSETLNLQSNNTQLLAANGQVAPAFFLPFQALKQVPGSSEKSVILRYWLNHDSINGPISLKIDGDDLTIKNSSFDSDALADKESLTFTSANWTQEA